MVIPTGNRRVAVEDLWLGKYPCPKCGTAQNHHLYKFKQNGYVLFVPVISITVKRGYACDRCRSFYELPKSEFKRAHNVQKAKYRDMTIPPDVVLRDCHPKKLKIGLKTFLCVLSLLFTVIMILGSVMMIADIYREYHGLDLGSVFFCTTLFPEWILPSVFAVRSLVIAKRKKAWYTSVAAENAIGSSDGYSS